MGHKVFCRSGSDHFGHNTTIPFQHTEYGYFIFVAPTL